MKRALVIVLTLGILVAMAAPAAADEYFNQQGLYVGKDFPSDQLIAHNYELAWRDNRNNLQLRKVLKVLGKEKLCDNPQFRVFLHYQRHDRPDTFQDDILVKRLDTDVWVMTDRSGNPENNSQIITRSMKRPAAQ